MGAPMTKTQLLADMRRAHAEWEGLLAEAGEARLTQPGVEGRWSIKDVTAHITVYERWQADLLSGAGPAAVPSPPGVDMLDTDERNAWFYEQDRDRPLRDVLAESREAHRRLFELTEVRSEEDLQALFSVMPEGTLRPASAAETPAPWPLWRWIASNSSEHYHQHLSALRVWLAKHGA